MIFKRLSVGVFWAFLLCLFCSTAAFSQATRTWVSGVGDDANPCSRTAPCKTFAGAISKTAATGEIDALDSGGFGAVTITKAITLDGNGTIASILASGTNGINVNAGITDTVIIRNISITGSGATPGNIGINYIAAASLVIDNVKIENFQNNLVNAALTRPGRLIINNLVGTKTLGGAATDGGIRMTTTSGILRAEIANSQLSENFASAIVIENNVNAAIKNTLITGGRMTGGPGLWVNNTVSGARSLISIDNCEFSYLYLGIYLTGLTGTQSSISLSNSSFNNNATAVSTLGDTQVLSYGNNRFNSNTTDTSGTLTPVTHK